MSIKLEKVALDDLGDDVWEYFNNRGDLLGVGHELFSSGEFLYGTAMRSGLRGLVFRLSVESGRVKGDWQFVNVPYHLLKESPHETLVREAIEGAKWIL